MGKLNEIYKYLNANQSKEKYYLVSNLVKKFDVTKKSAEAYYYKWKREYMQTSKCVPKDLVKTIKNKEVENVEKPIIINTPNNPTEEKKRNLEVTSMTIKGQYADYIRDGDKVICGEEVFYSIDDLEEYKKKEIANFYARLGEIYEVFELEVR